MLKGSLDKSSMQLWPKALFPGILFNKTLRSDRYIILSILFPHFCAEQLLCKNSRFQGGKIKI